MLDVSQEKEGERETHTYKYRVLQETLFVEERKHSFLSFLSSRYHFFLYSVSFFFFLVSFHFIFNLVRTCVVRGHKRLRGRKTYIFLIGFSV